MIYLGSPLSLLRSLLIRYSRTSAQLHYPTNNARKLPSKQLLGRLPDLHTASFCFEPTIIRLTFATISSAKHRASACTLGIPYLDTKSNPHSFPTSTVSA